jgi:hypothetical protein
LVGSLGSQGYVSSTQLLSSFAGLGTLGYISSTQLASSLASTVTGLGTVGYISSAALLSTTAGYASNFTTLSAYISELTVSSLTFGTGDGFLDMPDMRAPSLSTQVLFTSTINAIDIFGFETYTSSLQISSLVFRDAGLSNFGLVTLSNGSLLVSGSAVLTTAQVTSTTIGLGTIGYVSTISLISTTAGLGLIGYVSTPTLISTLISTTTGLGSIYKSTYTNVPLFSSLQFVGSSFTGNLADAQTLIIQEL